MIFGVDVYLYMASIRCVDVFITTFSCTYAHVAPVSNLSDVTENKKECHKSFYLWFTILMESVLWQSNHLEYLPKWSASFVTLWLGIIEAGQSDVDSLSRHNFYFPWMIHVSTPRLPGHIAGDVSTCAMGEYCWGWFTLCSRHSKYCG